MNKKDYDTLDLIRFKVRAILHNYDKNHEQNKDILRDIKRICENNMREYEKRRNK